MNKERFQSRDVPRFRRAFPDPDEPLTRIGDGELGGKAHGLAFIRDILASRLDAGRFPGVEIAVPALTVLTTDVFDAFISRNELAASSDPDIPDDRMALAFQNADLPSEIAGDLRGLVSQAHFPIAVRSSSLLEDAMFRPFAGVYETKMIPNNQPSTDVRFARLAEAIKFVYASMYFQAAKRYLRAAERSVGDERMAVVLQQVVGERHGDRYYPNLSGVARSFNFYPTGTSKAEDGVVNLALGLGKTIVDGGISWAYSPTRPAAPPPFGSVRELLHNTQLLFWAVNMGKPPEYDPIKETEYLLQADLSAADYDDTLKYIASTYSRESDRLILGVGNDGPRVLNFGPLLEFNEYHFNDLVRTLLAISKDTLGTEVEIEFAMEFPRVKGARARFGLLQVRPMVVGGGDVDISDEEWSDPDALLASERIMGNGAVRDIHDIVYVKPDGFEAAFTRAIASELEQFNRALQDERLPYVLIGFGRWGSSDPWLGIPVDWGQISGARVIVEATLPDMDVEPSQGSHFFQNLTSFGVGYLTVHHRGERTIDWEWLKSQPTVNETGRIRHVRLAAPLVIKLDARRGRGAIWRRN